MQIILKTRFQFPHWVMKNVLFPKVITTSKLFYLFWFKMEQTLTGLGVTRFTSASASACFLSQSPGGCATWHPRRPRGDKSGREKRRDQSYQAQAEKPLGTDSHRTISKRSSECYNLEQNCWENCILGQNFSKHRSCIGSSLSPFPWKQCCCVFKKKPGPWALVGSNIELGEGVFFPQTRPFGNSFVA